MMFCFKKHGGLMNSILHHVSNFVKKFSLKNVSDKYIKRFSLQKMFFLLLFQQCAQFKEGRSFSGRLRAFFPEKYLAPSQGELSKKLSHKLPVTVFKNTFHSLAAMAQDGKKKNKINKMLRIVDSSELHASPTMEWAKHRTTKNGLKLHMMIDGNLIPHSFRLKNGNSSDKKSLRWAIHKGFTYVFDRGYNDYNLFSDIIKKGAHFVTRSLKNISYRVVRKRQKKGKGVILDETIEVTSKGKPLRLRHIIFRFKDVNNKQQTFSLITDLMKTPAREVTEIYRDRWNIEVFFRWIKMFLQIRQWMSRSRNGVRIQFYSALIVYLMVLLSQKLENGQGSLILRDYAYSMYGHLLQNMIGSAPPVMEPEIKLRNF